MDNTVLGDSYAGNVQYFDTIFTNERFINLIYVHELNLFSSDSQRTIFSSFFG